LHERVYELGFADIIYQKKNGQKNDPFYELIFNDEISRLPGD